MTDIEMLPLPEGVDVIFSPDGNGAALDVFTAEQVQDYARANVEHHAAAKDAEIEALRAEVEKWERPCREFLDKTQWVQGTAKPHELGLHRADVLRQRIEQAEARAERLAEALREAEKSLRTIAELAGGTEYLMTIGDVRGYANSRAYAAREALRDHDQEGK